MPTPKQGYYLDGKRVPSVTTIISRFKESGGLIHWSWQCAWDGLMEARQVIEGLLPPDGYALAIERAVALKFLDRSINTWDYREIRQQAADAGSCAHEMIDDYLHGEAEIAYDPFIYNEKYGAEIVKMACPAFDAAKSWVKQSKFKVVETEVSLVSKEHKFGGTRDAILIDGKRAMSDWKTSNKVYPDYLCQLAAYGILDEEAGNNIDGGFHLLRFSKQEKPDDPVHFTHHYWSQLDAAKEAFLLMRQLYDLMQRLGKLAQ